MLLIRRTRPFAIQMDYSVANGIASWIVREQLGLGRIWSVSMNCRQIFQTYPLLSQRYMTVTAPPKRM